MNKIKCENCPLKTSSRDCPGGIFCKVFDPQHPKYNPKYLHRLFVQIGLEKAEYPPIIQQVKNVAYAIKGIVSGGFEKIMAEAYDERLKICQECEFYMSKESRCESCGCFVEEKIKWNDSECPVGKWGKVLPKDNEIIIDEYTTGNCNCKGGSNG